MTAKAEPVGARPPAAAVELMAANAALEARAQVLEAQLDLANKRIDALIEHLAENRAPLGPLG